MAHVELDGLRLLPGRDEQGRIRVATLVQTDGVDAQVLPAPTSALYDGAIRERPIHSASATREAGAGKHDRPCGASLMGEQVLTQHRWDRYLAGASGAWVGYTRR